MSKKMMARLLSALIALLLTAQPTLAASIDEDVTEAQAEPVEDFVEATESTLSGDDGDDPEAEIIASEIDAIDATLYAEGNETIPEHDWVMASDLSEGASGTSEGDGNPESPSDTGTDDDTDPDESGASETEVTPAPTATPDPSLRVFSSTAKVSGETWSGLKLVRAGGFKGKLASISGTLTLKNVTIEGQAARNVDLTSYFDLNPGAAIVIADGATLGISLSALSINRGSRKALKVTYNGQAVKSGKVKWKSSSKKLAAVSKKGVVSAKRRGAAVITASYKGQKALCYLDITGIVYPKSVSLKKKKVSLGLNGTVSLKARIKPAKVDDPTLTWTSSKPDVARVDAKGNVTGLSAGKATISVATSNGMTASCRVTVKAINPKSVKFNKLYVTMHPGEAFQTTLKLKPANASSTQMTYVSSNPSVAKVDKSGVITALKAGTATISATSPVKAKITDTCKVCVIDKGAAQLAGLVIGINPGHQRTTIKKRYPMAPGSHSYGLGVKVGATGVSTRQTEYNVVLSVGLKLKRILEEHGAKVVITRTTNDVMLTNIDRAKMLNNAGVDVALQLHCNSCSNPSKTGSSSYFRPNGQWADENRALAVQLSKYMSKATGFKNRGINPYTDFMSLNWTTTPSVLLEMGYLSNSSDDHKLAKDSFREKLAQGIYQGLCAYFGR